MQMIKRATIAIVIFLFFFTCPLTAFAGQDAKPPLERKSPEGVLVAPTYSPIKGKRIGISKNQPSGVYLQSNVSRFEAIKGYFRSITDALYISVSAKQEQEKSSYTVDDMGNAYTDTFFSLKTAVDDEHVKNIIVTNDILFTETLSVNRSISIKAEQKKRLVALSGIGRHFIVDGQGIALDVENIVFTGSTRFTGGGIATGGNANNSALHLKNCDFISNSTILDKKDGIAKGGALAIEHAPENGLNSSNATITIENCKFDSNKTVEPEMDNGLGGAIYLDAPGATLKIYNTIFTHNMGGIKGGAIAIFADASQTVDIENSSFYYNTANNGGALCLYSSADSPENVLDVSLKKVNVQNNKAFIGSERSSSLMGNGGGIYTCADSHNGNINMRIEACNVSNNKTYENGGGIFLTSGNNGFINCAISANTTIDSNSVDIVSGNGGGLAVLATGESHIGLNMGDTVVSSNEATYGGGIFINSLNEDMSAISIGSNSVIKGNKAGYGGGIMISNADVSMDGVVVNDNSARFSGGGIYLKNGSHASINNATIGNNRALVGEGNNNRAGGGVYIDTGSSASIGHTAFAANKADNGGGVYCDGTAEINGSAFGDNTANYGGGVYIRADAHADIADTTFTGNNAFVFFDSNRSAGGQGGAIYTRDASYSNMTLSGCSFRDNNAESGGYIMNKDMAATHDAAISNGSYTTPFTYAFNNFDVNYTAGQMATLYSIKVEYYYDDIYSEPVVERIDRAYEGSDVMESVVAGFGEGWMDMHAIEGYGPGKLKGTVEDTLYGDVVIKVLYTKTSASLPMDEEIEAMPGSIDGPTEETFIPTLSPEPPKMEMSEFDGAAGILPPSDEIAMAVAAPLPERQMNMQWSVFNLIIMATSLLTGISMLVRIARSSRRGRRAKTPNCIAEKAIGVLAGVVSVFIFAATQNTSLPSTHFDKWTPVLLLLLLTQLFLAMMIYYKTSVVKAKKAIRQYPNPQPNK